MPRTRGPGARRTGCGLHEGRRARSVDTLRLARGLGAAPPGLRERVLSAVRTLEQEPPEPTRPAPARRRPVFVPLAAGAAVLALVAPVLLGVELIRTQGRVDAQKSEAREIAHVLAAPDARVARGEGLSVVASPALRSTVITVTGLSAPPGGKDRQLWVISGSEPPRSLAVLPDRGSDTPVLASGLTSDASSLAVTAESVGGSKRPTSAPVVQLALESVVFGE
ncbi:anti-sigma factor [Streptomyces sp. NPDC052225]|uniref:anti-sigma factor n=1 Tax=Streptomyces sp. NPDC052225 TaxID=3154949 RepID=UPI003447112D